MSQAAQQVKFPRYTRAGILLSILLTACDMNSSAGTSIAIVNAKVWTGDSTRPWADAIAINGDTIVAVGSSAVHFIIGGFRLSSVQLRDAKTPEEFTRRIREFAATVPAGTWITGGDWDHEQWGGTLPTREWVDSVTPDHPVWVNRLDGHMALANSAALAAANVSRTTGDVSGGEIVRTPTGEPTGVLKDNAQDLVSRVVPDPAPSLEDRALDTAMTYVAAQGVTTVHNMGTWNDLAIFERDTVAARGTGDDWLRIGGLKGFVDGSLGSHTAAMLEPFTDAPNDRGLFVNTPEDLYTWTSAADKAGLHVIIHAIGDRAIRTLLDTYARVAAENGVRDRRFRMEHAQHIAPADMPRFAELGVIASMQPYHAIDDGRWAERVIGPERAKGTYAFKSLLDAKATLAFGSDWFVAPPTPIEGIYAAVTRRTLDDRNPGGWIPDQKITVEDALRAYTTGSAYASFEEARKGTLARGKLADLVLIDRDLTVIPPETIRDARVQMTVVGGRVVFERQ